MKNNENSTLKNVQDFYISLLYQWARFKKNKGSR